MLWRRLKKKSRWRCDTERAQSVHSNFRLKRCIHYTNTCIKGLRLIQNETYEWFSNIYFSNMNEYITRDLANPITVTHSFTRSFHFRIDLFEFHIRNGRRRIPWISMNENTTRNHFRSFSSNAVVWLSNEINHRVWNRWVWCTFRLNIDVKYNRVLAQLSTHVEFIWNVPWTEIITITNANDIRCLTCHLTAHWLVINEFCLNLSKISINTNYC